MENAYELKIDNKILKFLTIEGKIYFLKSNVKEILEEESQKVEMKDIVDTMTEIADDTIEKELKPITDEQIEVLEKEFVSKKYLDIDEMTALAEKLHLEYDQVKNWFTKRRVEWNNSNNEESKMEKQLEPKR